MRAISSIASITVHCSVAAALLFGTAKAGHSNLKRPVEITVIPPLSRHEVVDHGLWAPLGPTAISIDVISKIPLPEFVIESSTTRTAFVSSGAPVSASIGSGRAVEWVEMGSESGPQILTGPLPQYPELLREAGVEGHVVLEAIVDTTGRIQRDSILVVSATNPEFAASARRALSATLFRPAFVAGHAVRTRIRVPFEFMIQNGPRHPR